MSKTSLVLILRQLYNIFNKNINVWLESNLIKVFVPERVILKKEDADFIKVNKNTTKKNRDVEENISIDKVSKPPYKINKKKLWNLFDTNINNDTNNNLEKLYDKDNNSFCGRPELNRSGGP